jgi:hypothetical protein
MTGSGAFCDLEPIETVDSTTSCDGISTLKTALLQYFGNVVTSFLRVRSRNSARTASAANPANGNRRRRHAGVCLARWNALAAFTEAHEPA